MNTKELQEELKIFVSDRGWQKLHTAKNLVLALSIEVSELAEIFLWKDENEVTITNQMQEEIEGEIADIIIYCTHIANEFNIDIMDAVIKKLEINKKRFPKKD